MAGYQQQQAEVNANPAFRLDVPLHDLLIKPGRTQTPPSSCGPPQSLPDPLFPNLDNLMENDIREDAGQAFGRPGIPPRRTREQVKENPLRSLRPPRPVPGHLRFLSAPPSTCRGGLRFLAARHSSLALCAAVLQTSSAPR